MDNVLIDDRRIHVDFSQSVAKMRWRGKGRGVEYLDKVKSFYLFFKTCLKIGEFITPRLLTRKFVSQQFCLIFY